MVNLLWVAQRILFQTTNIIILYHRKMLQVSFINLKYFPKKFKIFNFQTWTSGSKFGKGWQSKKLKQDAVHKTWTHLNTIGAGTQNLMRIFLMLSFRFLASRHQDVCSLAAPPSVGSGPPLTDFISVKRQNKHAQIKIQWGSEYQNSLVLEW